MKIVRLLRSFKISIASHRAFSLSNVSLLSTSRRSPEEMEKLLKNPYYAKYQQKLDHMKKTSPDDFKSKLESLPSVKAPTQSNNQKPEKISEKKVPDQIHRTPGQPKTLESIMKVELIQDKSAEEIQEIWKEYHKKKECMFAVIEKDEYEHIHEKATQYPTFLFPIPRQDGYEFIMSQFSGHKCYFTPLAAFQIHRENAPVCLTINYFPELKEEKGIVLMVGDIDFDVLKMSEAMLLSQQMQLYYGPMGEDRFHLVRQFHDNASEFKHMNLVSELQRITSLQ